MLSFVWNVYTVFAIQGDSNNGFTVGKLETTEDTKY